MRFLEKWAQACAILTVFSIPISTTATSVLFPLTALLSLATGDWHDRFSFLKTNRVAQLFLGLFVLYLLGTIYTIAPAKDVTHTLIKHNWILLTPILMPLFFEKKWRCYAIDAFLLAMVLTLVLSFAKFSNLLNIPINVPGQSSVFKDYIAQSFLMSIAFCICCYRCKYNSNPWLYAILAVLMIIDIIFLSQGRTGYIVFFVLLIYTLIALWGWKKGTIIAICSIIMLLALAYAFSPFFITRSQQTLENVKQFPQGQKNNAVGVRIAWQKNALKLIQQHPIIGYGTGSITKVYATVPNNIFSHEVTINDSTNIYLNFALQFGIIGLAYFVFMTIMQLRYSLLLASELKFTTHVVLIGILLGGLANSWLTDFTSAHFYSAMMAICFAALSQEQASSRAKRGIS